MNALASPQTRTEPLVSATGDLTASCDLPAIYEYPCTGKPVQPEPLVLLHGWGSDSRVWQALLPELTPHLNVLAIDLPGFGGSPELDDDSLAEYLRTIAEVLPARCSLLGWSLGGMLATLLASRHPQRVKNLITLASNACFVSQPNWPCAMADRTFAEFSAFFQQQPALCLKRFHGLQAKGDLGERALLKTLRETFDQPGADSWQRGLALLSEIDNRTTIASLAVNGLHLFGETDQLVPAEAADAIAKLNKQQQVEVLERVSHVPHLSCPERLSARLLDFLHSQCYSLDKQRVAASFGRAANSYDAVARLQCQVGEQLLDRLPEQSVPAQIVDLGCGTGFFTEKLCARYPNGSIMGVDLAQGMVQFARNQRDISATWLCGDAEQLPLADASVDLIFSNLAVQWCKQMPQLASEIARVLRPGGKLVFSSLGTETLHQLKAAWAEVDNYVHVNEFTSAAQWRSTFENAGFAFDQLEVACSDLFYRDLRHLTDELKGVGAHNINGGQNRGLTGREQIRQLISAYEKYRDPNGQLPATWEVIYGVAVHYG